METHFLAPLFSIISYNTLIVSLGTLILGVSAGLLSPFLILRRKTLLSDALSHSTLPGIAIAFLLSSPSLLLNFKLWILLLGGFVSSLFSIFLMQLIETKTKLDVNTIIGTVFCIFFGLGLVLVSYIQYIDSASQAGLTHFIFGQAASMNQFDLYLICLLSLITLIFTLVYYRGFIILSFDHIFASSINLPLKRIDFLLSLLATCIILIGLQSVGILLIVALLIIPASIAMLWSQHLPYITLISASCASLGCFLGTIISAQFENMPTGPLIVMVLTGLFLISFITAPHSLLALKIRQSLKLKKQEVRIES